jgi:hypothetical protein
MPVKHKYPYVGGAKWAFMKWADIPDKKHPGWVYLRRLRMFQTPLFSVYLHFIYSADTDRDPHNHPWTFWSLILRGGYTERVFTHSCNRLQSCVLRSHRRFSGHRMPKTHAHMIDSLKPGLVTLIFAGSKKQDWGFFTPDGFVRWQDYQDSTGVNPPEDEFG